MEKTLKKSEMKQEHPLSTLHFNIVLVVLQFGAIRQKKKNRGIQRGKEKVKLSLFAGDMILYISNHRNPIVRKLLINKFHGVKGYRITLHKSAAFST